MVQSQVERAGLRPLIPGSFKLWGMRRKGSAEKRRLRRTCEVADQARLAMNALYDAAQYACEGDRLVSPPSAGKELIEYSFSKASFIQGTRQNIWSNSAKYVRGGGAREGRERVSACALPDVSSRCCSNFASNLVGYESQGVKAEARMLTAKNVDLPQEAGTADMLSLLPPRLKRFYSREENVVLSSPPVELPKAASMVAGHAAYVQIVRRLFRLGMVRFLRKAMAVNGMFGVDKDKEQGSVRFIANLTPGNSFFCEPEELKLPGPDLLSQLHCGAKLWVYVQI